MSIPVKQLLIALTVSFALVLLGSACVPLPPPPAPEPTATIAPPTSAPPATPVTATLTLAQLKNGIYASEQAPGGKLTLVNGVFGAAIGAGATQKITVTLTEPAALGDLNGDGAADAAVILTETMGGTGVFRSLHAVLNEGGKPVDAASVLLGDRVQIKSLTIQSGAIIVDLMTHGPKDSLCCPTMEVVRTYLLQGKSLFLNSNVQRPTIHLATATPAR